MTLLFFDGFDAQDAPLKWTVTDGTTVPGYTSTTRYSAGHAATTSGSVGLTKGITPSSKVFVGLALKVTAFNATNGVVGFSSDSGGTKHLSVRVTTSGALSLYRSTTLLASSAAGVLTLNAWHYIEVSATLADSGGTAAVRVDGATVIDFTGDTRNSGTSTNIDAVTLWAATGATSSGGIIDDLYILNNSGTKNNNFLGEVMVQTLQVTGAGSSANQTPYGSGTNWQNVDELPYSTGDYNASSSANVSDLYSIADAAPGLTTVYGVQTNVIAGKTEPGTGNVRPILRVGGTTYQDSTKALASTPTWTGSARENNPTTGVSWTTGDVNSLEIGSEVL